MLLALFGWLLPASVWAQSASGTAVVRHAPEIEDHGRVEGSVQQLLGENVEIEGYGTITGDLLVPGT